MSKLPSALAAILALPLWLTACAPTPDRLPELDRRFYANLATPADQDAFLELRDDERQAFLEQKGLWELWIALPAEQREAAAAGEVRVGFQEFALFMAWGPPADTQDRDTLGRPMRVHTFIECTSGPKAGRHVQRIIDCDGTSTETRVSVRDGIVAEIQYQL